MQVSVQVPAVSFITMTSAWRRSWTLCIAVLLLKLHFSWAEGLSRNAVHSEMHPDTWHRWTCLALTPVRWASTQFTYPRGMEGWVDLSVCYVL